MTAFSYPLGEIGIISWYRDVITYYSLLRFLNHNTIRNYFSLREVVDLLNMPRSLGIFNLSTSIRTAMPILFCVKGLLIQVVKH